MNKLLTIVIPCYQMEGYLRKCVESLDIRGLAKNRLSTISAADALEVIIVNDGSKDRTIDIAHDLSEAYPGVVRVIDKPNGHYGSCINVGLAAAQGDYIKILEPDDTYDTANFSAYLPYLEQMAAKKVDVVLTDLIRVDAKGRTTREGKHNLEEGLVYPISSLVSTGGCTFNGGLTYRTELLRSIGYRQMEGVCYSDTQWYLIPVCYAKTLACFPHVIYRYFCGRDDQSMNRVQYAKNTWMMEKVALDLLENYDMHTRDADSKIAARYNRFVYETLLSIYVACIICKEKKYSKTDLRVLDGRIEKESPELYRRLDEAFWSNKIPYRYVHAWRAGSFSLPIMAWICDTYSKMLKFCRIV